MDQYILWISRGCVGICGKINEMQAVLLYVG